MRHVAKLPARHWSKSGRERLGIEPGGYRRAACRLNHSPGAAAIELDRLFHRTVRERAVALPFSAAAVGHYISP